MLNCFRLVAFYIPATEKGQVMLHSTTLDANLGVCNVKLSHYQRSSSLGSFNLLNVKVNNHSFILLTVALCPASVKTIFSICFDCFLNQSKWNSFCDDDYQQVYPAYSTSPSLISFKKTFILNWSSIEWFLPVQISGTKG